jgi:Caspase domain/Clp amino terminal domain, pathogenicity island component
MAKFALLIGVSEYEPGLDGLPSAVNDATAIKQVLTNPDMGEFADTAVTVLQNPDRQAMEDAIYNLFANRQRDDLVLLYFSGHGVVDDRGEFYFASCRTRKEQGRLMPTTATAARSVHDWMEASRSQRKVIILDSCFSGAFAQGVKAKDSGSINPAQFLGSKGTAILTASTSTQYALTQEGFDLSVYTHYLVEGIRTGGADQDNDGFIGMEELHTYASSKVKEAAPAMTPEFYPVKEGYKILLAKSPKDDPTLKYRKQVEQRAYQGTFSIPARCLLNSLRFQLSLAPEVAEKIEAEVLQPYRAYQRKLKEYEQTLVEALQAENPLNQRTLNDLKDYQQHLALEDSDIQSIHERLIDVSLMQKIVAPETYVSKTSSTSEEAAAEQQFGEQQTGETKAIGYERFTEKAIRVVRLAEKEARRLGHNFVGSEQILIGLIGEGTSLAAKQLASKGIKLKNAQMEVEKIIGRGSGFVQGKVSFTPTAKRVLKSSSEEARQLGHKYIDTGHLLLGLLREDYGAGARVLKILGVKDFQRLRTSILQELANIAY